MDKRASQATVNDEGGPSFTQRMSNAPTGSDVLAQKIVPHGALVARKLKTGAIQFYWRWTTAGRVDRERIGLFDRKLPPKKLDPVDGAYTLAGAALAAQRLALDHDAALNEGLGGLRGVQAVRSAEVAAAREAAIQAEAVRLKAASEQQARSLAESKARAERSLQRLLIAYCDHLADLDRRSHRDARSIFAIHVLSPWPQLASSPANEVSDEMVADVLRLIIEKGHARTAAKCRAYLAAAFETARKARTDAQVPVAFKAFEIRTNPASATAVPGGARTADKNPLSASQMRSYWRAIRDVQTPMGAMLRLHLLTGGQRIEQLVRLKTSDIREETILLFDGKGRPGQSPRPHPLPLLPATREALELIAPKGQWALSTDKGETHIAATTLSAAAKAAGVAIEGFATKRLRSGVETLLASAGISKETRGRLQSHGISGVQATHYDGHDYVPEKLLALETLTRLLEAEDAKIVPIRSAAA
jgi:integrase